MPSADAAAAWAASGAMWLSGMADGPPALAPGHPALMVTSELDGFAATARRWSPSPPERADLPGPGLLAERAAALGLQRNAPFSAGGRCRVLPTRDGAVALSLARDADLALLPALLGADLPTPTSADAQTWDRVARWCASQDAAVVHERLVLLSLPGRALVPPEAARVRPGALSTTFSTLRPGPERPLVVDFSSLWAGPLCAHLLGLAGCDVVKVESISRPDGARWGPPRFYDLLHAGHRSVALDFSDESHLALLRRLVGSATVVIEGSRPRALARLGLDALQAVACGTVWVSVTAEGRDVDAVGFGDDVAAAAGFVTMTPLGLAPVGDALADPLTGVAAARAVGDALATGEARLIDVSMLDVCRDAYGDGSVAPHTVEPTGPNWTLRTATGDHLVRPPQVRAPAGRAPASGEHTESFLRGNPW